MTAELAERPGRVAAHERRIMRAQGVDEGGDGGPVAAVAEGDGGVAREPVAFGAFDRPAPEALAVLRYASSSGAG